jgi:sterol desaturase/sphingolipid hydroxylase (fatty acid hydroxylase superfamily)
MPVSQLQSPQNQIELLQAPVPSSAPSKSVRSSRFRVLSRTKIEAIIALSLLSGLVALACSDAAVVYQTAKLIKGFWGNYFESVLSRWLFNPIFYAVFASALILERIFPAMPAPNGKRIFNVAFNQDLLWTAVHISLSVVLLPLCVTTFSSVCENHFSLKLGFINEMPVVTRWVLAFLVADFFAWLAHYLRHKINLLWQFHAVHHSQPDLNFFSESRRHPVDTFVAYVRLLLPFFFFHLPLEAIGATYWLRRWHERLYHCNIKTDLGVLRYILVTPQSHRVHHSKDILHRDTNFGETLSIWDYMFNTQYRKYDEYPETGVEDSEFPLEQEQTMRGFRSHLILLWRQFTYPFKVILKS